VERLQVFFGLKVKKINCMKKKKEKECRHCEQTLPHSEFNNNKTQLDGKSLYCRKCTSEKAKAYRQANYEYYREAERASAARRKDEIKAYHKTYYAKPEIKAKMKEYHKEYRKNNPERIKKIFRKFYEKNRERILQEKAEWWLNRNKAE
jgi:hypothetical protein